MRRLLLRLLLRRRLRRSLLLLLLCWRLPLLLLLPLCAAARPVSAATPPSVRAVGVLQPTCPLLLPSSQVGGEFAISSAEQRRQIDALKALELCFAALGPEAAAQFEGLSLR